MIAQQCGKLEKLSKVSNKALLLVMWSTIQFIRSCLAFFRILGMILWRYHFSDVFQFCWILNLVCRRNIVTQTPASFVTHEAAKYTICSYSVFEDYQDSLCLAFANHSQEKQFPSYSAKIIKVMNNVKP